MRYTLNFRIWHWINAIVVLGLLATVFLRKTFLSWRANSEILFNKLAEMGIEVSAEQAKVLAKSIRAEMWQWHIILGYVLAFLILYRIVLYFQDRSSKKPFSTLTPHKKGVKLLYYLVYFALFFMAISGFGIHFYAELQFTKEFVHELKEFHELAFYVVMFFVPLHIAGVVIAENRDEKGLISSMINGDELPLEITPPS